LLQVAGGLTVFFMITKAEIFDVNHSIFGVLGALVAFCGRLIQSFGDDWFDWFEDD